MNNTVEKIREFAAGHPRMAKGAIAAAVAVVALDVFTSTASLPEDDYGTLASVSTHHDEIGRPIYPILQARTILDTGGSPRLPVALDIGNIVTSGSKLRAGGELDLKSQVSQIDLDQAHIDSVTPQSEAQNFNRPSDAEVTQISHQPGNSPGLASVNGYTFPLRATKRDLIGKGWCYQSAHKSCHAGHPAADLIVAPGTEVVAMRGGTILTRKRNTWKCSIARGHSGYPSIQIQGDDGRYYFYAHFESHSLTPKMVGQHVDAGEKLGIVGHANCGQGTPHLHIQWAGKVIEGNKQSDDIQAPLYNAFQKLPG